MGVMHSAIMGARTVLVVLLLAGGVVACSEKRGDPPPPAPRYGVMVAPPNALGARAASAQTPGAAAFVPEDEGSDDFDAPEDSEAPSPDVAPEEGVPL